MIHVCVDWLSTWSKKASIIVENCSLHIHGDIGICGVENLPGVSIKAGYRQSTTTCKTSYRRLFGFHSWKKMILKNKSKYSNDENHWIFKCYKNSMLFDAQNAGNRISKLLDFKFFWGADPPLGGGGLTTPLLVTATFYTFSGYF